MIPLLLPHQVTTTVSSSPRTVQTDLSVPIPSCPDRDNNDQKKSQYEPKGDKKDPSQDDGGVSSKNHNNNNNNNNNNELQVAHSISCHNTEEEERLSDWDWKSSSSLSDTSLCEDLETSPFLIIDTTSVVSCPVLQNTTKIPLVSIPAVPTSCLIATTGTTTAAAAGTATTTRKKHRKIGRGAVRGLWPEEEDTIHTSTRQLSDGLLTKVFSFLPMQDLVRCEEVSLRWQTVSGREELWTNVDASDYVAETHARFQSLLSSSSSSSSLGGTRSTWCCIDGDDKQHHQVAVWTTHQLTQLLQSHHSIKRLTIRNVHHQLSADHLYLPFWKLSEVSIGEFDGLTDTHIRSLLFLSSLHRNQLPLVKIQLHDCTQVSKACLISIQAFCPNAMCSFVEERGEK